MPCSDGGRDSASRISFSCSWEILEALLLPTCPVQMDDNRSLLQSLAHSMTVLVARSTSRATTSTPTPSDSMRIASDLRLISLYGDFVLCT